MTYPDPSASLAQAKALIRREALARRDALEPAWRAEASARIAERIGALHMHLASQGRIDVAGGYLPIRSEVDPRSAMAGLRAQGMRVAVPAIVAGELVFRELASPEAATQAQGFGTVAPGADADELQPRLLLVPLAAFDARGGRCGYGRGYYDRAIARLRGYGPVVTIGLAFEAQCVDAVPMEPHDRRLDMIVTENAVHRR